MSWGEEVPAGRGSAATGQGEESSALRRPVGRSTQARQPWKSPHAWGGFRSPSGTRPGASDRAPSALEVGGRVDVTGWLRVERGDGPPSALEVARVDPDQASVAGRLQLAARDHPSDGEGRALQ